MTKKKVKRFVVFILKKMLKETDFRQLVFNKETGKLMVVYSVDCFIGREGARGVGEPNNANKYCITQLEC